MAGGVAFLTATGAALGARQGAAVSNAYFGSIKGFEIKKLREGKGPALLFIDGFLTEGAETLPPWLLGSQRRFPDNPLYAVSWESKRLASLGTITSRWRRPR